MQRHTAMSTDPTGVIGHIDHGHCQVYYAGQFVGTTAVGGGADYAVIAPVAEHKPAPRILVQQVRFDTGLYQRPAPAHARAAKRLARILARKVTA